LRNLADCFHPQHRNNCAAIFNSVNVSMPLFTLQPYHLPQNDIESASTQSVPWFKVLYAYILLSLPHHHKISTAVLNLPPDISSYKETPIYTVKWWMHWLNCLHVEWKARTNLLQLGGGLNLWGGLRWNWRETPCLVCSDCSCATPEELWIFTGTFELSFKPFFLGQGGIFSWMFKRQTIVTNLTSPLRFGQRKGLICETKGS